MLEIIQTIIEKVKRNGLYLFVTPIVSIYYTDLSTGRVLHIGIERYMRKSPPEGFYVEVLVGDSGEEHTSNAWIDPHEMKGISYKLDELPDIGLCDLERSAIQIALELAQHSDRYWQAKTADGNPVTWQRQLNGDKLSIRVSPPYFGEDAHLDILVDDVVERTPEPRSVSIRVNLDVE